MGRCGMRMIIILFAVMALIGVAWYFLTRTGVIPAIDFPANIFDGEAVRQWFAKKLKEITELIGYEPGAI
jgi:hypothetical protein